MNICSLHDCVPAHVMLGFDRNLVGEPPIGQRG